MNFMPFGQLKSFLKILIKVQYKTAIRCKIPTVFCSLPWGRTGFDGGRCGMISEPWFHLHDNRWARLNINAEQEYALAA